jgi:hypothetical protein
MPTTRRSAALALFLMALAACGQGNKQAEAPPAPPQPVEQTYRWMAEGASTVSEGPPVLLRLSEGYALAFLPQTPVAPGDTVTANISFQGEAGKVVAFILQRHCDAANGEDNQSNSVRLHGQPQSAEVSLTFAQSYSCVRLTVASADRSPVNLTVTELRVTKTSAATGEIRD